MFVECVGKTVDQSDFLKDTFIVHLLMIICRISEPIAFSWLIYFQYLDWITTWTLTYDWTG
jgi:hypothetical protein